MEWKDRGIVLSARPHGENGAIVDLFTAAHGRHVGLVRGGTSRRLQPVLQPGNTVLATWRARLEEHLGTYTLELMEARAGWVIDNPFTLAGLSSVCAVAALALPEREVHPALYDAFEVLLDTLRETDVWPAVMVRWELGLLRELGFGLDLKQCAATGVVDGLIYVSPKSGKAVSREAGAPYRERLFRLPRFLISSQAAEADPNAVSDGFQITGHFMERHVFGPYKGKLPDARIRLQDRLNRRAAECA